VLPSTRSLLPLLLQLNLPPGMLQIVSTLLVLVSPFAKFALTLEPVAQGVDSSLGIPSGVSTATPVTLLQKQGIRSGLAIFSLLLATKVPFFGVFMSILGSFLTITVSVLFPCMAHLSLNWTRLTDGQKAVDYGVLSIGSVATVLGTITAFQALPFLSQNELELFGTTHATGAALYKTLVCHSVCHAI
jgi:solute carrier family 32 (vesicular inhibitory amino acid transporter)